MLWLPKISGSSKVCFRTLEFYSKVQIESFNTHSTLATQFVSVASTLHYNMRVVVPGFVTTRISIHLTKTTAENIARALCDS